jgi:hypothetical protein
MAAYSGARIKEYEKTSDSDGSFRDTRSPSGVRANDAERRELSAAWREHIYLHIQSWCCGKRCDGNLCESDRDSDADSGSNKLAYSYTDSYAYSRPLHAGHLSTEWADCNIACYGDTHDLGKLWQLARYERLCTV